MPLVASASTPLRDPIVAAVEAVAGRYYRLVLVVGPGPGKTQALLELEATRAWPRVNVNLRLSERLLELTKEQRCVRARELLDDILGHDPVVLMDNLEVLFHPELTLNPLSLLQQLSRTRTVVAAWGGTFLEPYLHYAEPGHPEVQRYPSPDAIIVQAGPTTSS